MTKHLTWLVAACAILVLASVGSSARVASGAAAADNYVVLYKSQSVPANAATTIQQAGGSLVYAYDQIGVAIASSSNASFRSNLLASDKSVENASSTAGFATKVENGLDSGGDQQGDLPNAPATDGDTFSVFQWDMRQIKTPQAHAITGGSPSVLVGDIDTGIDFNHPDLRQNIDVANSANCLSGAPVAGLAAQDDNGHGTHTAGTIAAASNGIGIVGVAPNVKVAAIKAGDAAGFFFPQAVICSFMWAGSHHMDVTNNSYFADPYEYNCRNDPVQRAIWKGEQRAILYAEQQGVTVVAAEGNDSDDTAHPTTDITSPDDPPGAAVQRTITNACVIVPVEVPGVIGVSATGSTRQVDGDNDPNDYLKSFYSSYGVGVTQLTAPGGDSVFRTAESVNGRVLSTWPPNLPCTRKRTEAGDVTEPTAVYCYQQGTSMASPHVAGVAALIISRFGNSSGKSNMNPGQVKAYLDQTADPQPCPTELPAGYLGFTGVNSGAVQSCQGGTGYNSWYGNGQVNALSAVTR
ncbi:MAG: lantibiotic leader peptide-processing serine protease [Gaiellaceae bacterium]|nr:lantibiotic leader peptide-processing serine protease [Gaiellaceae bacterium]